MFFNFVKFRKFVQNERVASTHSPTSLYTYSNPLKSFTSSQRTRQLYIQLLRSLSSFLSSSSSSSSLSRMTSLAHPPPAPHTLNHHAPIDRDQQRKQQDQLLSGSKPLTLKSLLENPIEFVKAKVLGRDEQVPYKAINQKVRFYTSLCRRRGKQLGLALNHLSQ